MGAAPRPNQTARGSAPVAAALWMLPTVASALIAILGGLAGTLYRDATIALPVTSSAQPSSRSPLPVSV
ncbi:hypothetical protein EB835_02065 [Brevibacterium sp. S22]|nr:hypothetical protein EB835_02065 [Brevibacterium sp. S22]